MVLLSLSMSMDLSTDDLHESGVLAFGDSLVGMLAILVSGDCR